MDNMIQQKDLVLNINEYAYILDSTKGEVRCAVGPYKFSLSQSDVPVRFDYKSKKFMPCSMNDAIKLFCSAPENWYCILKNPVVAQKTDDGVDRTHPPVGTMSNSPVGIKIGRKINIPGPTSFALYPGQMAKVVQGHRLRSNQYLLARVYDADAANTNEGIAQAVDGGEVKSTKAKYVTGQLIVIKGTEYAFYIPPTGIEVIPVNNEVVCGYVRDAVTLERLEYCILKDEDGNKRYLHGPDVVFPEPTETFVENHKGNFIFRAIELSKISGIYIKVIAKYTDEDGNEHPVGEELFLTGDDTMIYYPRPEHALISYDSKYMHHAIAIPKGEARYIMNRLTGEITTVRGPRMYLPDPRTEVVVKRKLSPTECRLWYPGNQTVLDYNESISEKSVEKQAAYRDASSAIKALYTTNACTVNADMTLQFLETNAGISRGTSYTKPRTITLDTKYDGAVNIDIWNGYAVNVISKSGNKDVVIGPSSRLLDYDETLQILNLSTGAPKNRKNKIPVVYLQVKNNKIHDIVRVRTKDDSEILLDLTYTLNFLEDYKDKWFAVEDYVDLVCSYYRLQLKSVIQTIDVKDFYNNSASTLGDILLGEAGCAMFEDIGACVNSFDIRGIRYESDIEDMIEDFNHRRIEDKFNLNDEEESLAIRERLIEVNKAKFELEQELKAYKDSILREKEKADFDYQVARARATEEENAARKQAEYDLQTVVGMIADAKLAREKADFEVKIEQKEKLAALEKDKQDAYAKSVVEIMNSISPSLAASLDARANADILKAVSSSIAPYALANGESSAEVVNRLLRGTSLEGIVENITSK